MKTLDGTYVRFLNSRKHGSVMEVPCSTTHSALKMKSDWKTQYQKREESISFYKTNMFDGKKFQTLQKSKSQLKILIKCMNIDFLIFTKLLKIQAKCAKLIFNNFFAKFISNIDGTISIHPNILQLENVPMFSLVVFARQILNN